MKKNISLIILFLMLFSNAVFSANTTNAKLKQLESQVKQLQQQIKQLKKDIQKDSSYEQRIAALESYALSLIEAIANMQEQLDDNTDEMERMSDAQETKPSISLYGTLVAEKVTNQNSLLDGQSFELVISGQPHKRISYFTELEFERAATVGGQRGGEVLVEQAYTDLTITPWLNLRGGVLLVPFGNIERDHYAPLRDVISKPYTSLAIAPSDWTDNGLGFNGKFNLSDNWIADYQTYVIAGLGNGLSTTGLRATRQGFGVDNNNNKAIASKITLHDTSGLSIGLSHYKGAWDDLSSKSINGYNLDLNFQLAWYELVAEYSNMNIDRLSTGSAKMQGYYLRNLFSLEGLFEQDWLGEDFSHPKLTFVAQLDAINIENYLSASLPDNWEKRITIGLNLDVTHSWRAKLNYEHAWSAQLDQILRGDDDVWSLSLGYLF